MAEWKKLRVFGEGSYGTVYLVLLRSIEEQNPKISLLALKTSSSYSMLREKKVFELLRGCEGIVQCYYYKCIVERGYLTYNLFMEYAPHGSLGNLIKTKLLSDKEVIVYTHMLLKGLSCMHEKGIVHCDLKPDNILLFPSWDDRTKYQLKISDFGLSKTSEEANADLGEIKFRGTPYYMSPESLAFFNEAPKIPDELSYDCKDFLKKCLINDPQQRWTAKMLLDHPFIQKEYPTSLARRDRASLAFGVVLGLLELLDLSGYFGTDWYLLCKKLALYSKNFSWTYGLLSSSVALRGSFLALSATFQWLPGVEGQFLGTEHPHSSGFGV
ncbi:mitogen-activated protein kinase kinase kinase 20-like [Vigna umbellata]|uniref:mitogen-activated protein kinase kinase kinase 20-like n=1 Tax=Vigna umbellata TaxID=87088 RepID=UPI001F5FD75D|nr:mitogen-activated protein kinase kinase kinase 20-like [Vigna umbellata]